MKLSRSPELTPEREEDSGSPERGARSRPHVWVSTTYFAEGFPYSIVNNLAEVLFKEMGAGLGAVGLTSLFHLPWNIKFLWAPWLDRYETKRFWITVLQWALAGLLFVVALLAGHQQWISALVVSFVLLAVLSASNDIVIDGYYMEALHPEQQSRFVGYRAMAYKVSSLLVRGPVFIGIGWVGWSVGLGALAVLMALLALVHAWILPQAEVRRQTWREGMRAVFRAKVLLSGAALSCAVLVLRALANTDGFVRAQTALVDALPFLRNISLSGWISLGLLFFLLGGSLWYRRRAVREAPPKDQAEEASAARRAFAQFLAMPRVGLVIAFVILFRTGESLLQKMKWPFLSDELGVSLAQYGFANGTLGVAASFLATLWGGRLIARDGLRRWLWPFLIAQNGLNLLYVGMALLPGIFRENLPLITGLIALEEFGSGLGTAVFMIYLMRICHVEHKASHFAILTALMSLSFTFAGAVSGFLAAAWGYAPFFFVTFLAAIPMMILARVLFRDPATS